MSRTFRCFAGDGDCFIPDQALVLVEGHARVATSDATASLLLQRLHSEAAVQLVPRLEDDEHEAFLTGTSLRSSSEPDSGVIATCGCGHINIWR